MGGTKGLIMGPLVLALLWMLGTLACGIGYPAFTHLIYWTINSIAGSHAFVGSALGMGMALPVLLFLLRSGWKDFKREGKI